MKKIILAVVSAIGMGCSLPASLEAQEVLSLVCSCVVCFIFSH